MLKYLVRSIFFIGLFFRLIFCSEQMDVASQFSKGCFRGAFYYFSSFSQPVLQTTTKELIEGTTPPFFSEVNKKYTCESKSQGVGLKIMYRPWEGLYYYTKLGLQEYALEIPSVTVTNKLEGSSPGWFFGLGVKCVIFPDTIVSPAVSASLGLTYKYSHLDYMSNEADTKASIDTKFATTEFEGYLSVSKKLYFRPFTEFEPYAGIGILRQKYEFRDNISFGKVSGEKDFLDGSFGIRLKFSTYEAVMLEYIFLGEQIYSGGIILGF